MPTDPMKTIEKIEKTLLASSMPISINKIAKKTGLHYTTVKRYVNLLEFAKKMPKIEVLKREGTTLVRLERDLSKLDEEESKKIIRQHFPELDEEEKFLISLLEKNATKESRAIKLNRTKMLERMIKLERVKETKDKKFYLTQLGYGIASGAKEIYLAKGEK